ncbi:MAG: hypothetical protein U9Q04_04290 [Campylobacterota bacterium]|nr:hypothetical protein [Campylobacterota bacterium]
MKKLSIISDQIKNNTYSYTGKGSFEALVKEHKDSILDWLEELIPLQQQIEQLNELSGLEFQKRNYTRILTKLFPEEYTQFVSLNILVRDASIISSYYNNDYDLTSIYNKLISNKYLKYPGKYEKYVEFNIFQKFVILYRDDLVSMEQNDHQVIDDTEKEKIVAPVIEQKEEQLTVNKNTQNKNDTEKDTNWTNLLLGKLK